VPHIALPEGLPGITAERETIAAFVSSRNDCDLCFASHRSAAAHHLGGDYGVVDAVKRDYQTAPARKGRPTWKSTTPSSSPRRSAYTTAM
jgi:AhpD family alkylhydroperoxidase